MVTAARRANLNREAHMSKKSTTRQTRKKHTPTGTAHAAPRQRVLRNLGATVGAHVRPHGLRHAAITQAIDAAARKGLSIDEVRQFSRHKGIGTLLIYRDLRENKQGTIAAWVSEKLPAGR